MYKQHFYYGNSVITSEIKRVQVRNELQVPKGLAFFCPNHHKVWAQAVVENSESNVIKRVCKDCPPSLFEFIPGSVWLSWDESWNERLPEAVLKLEFLLHYEELLSCQKQIQNFKEFED